MPARDNEGRGGSDTTDDVVTGFIEPIEIQEEMERSFLEYSMSVIVSRALPDVRDGLKPVHRRILYSMYDQRLLPDRPHTKCAKVVGDVMGSYHPHGDSAIYEALARMVQDFSMRHPLIDGHGNFGGTGPGRGSGGHALHGVPARRAGPRADERHRPGDGRLHRQLRRHLRGADGPAGALPQHAGQRLPGHRRGHGDEHPAPQPGRGHRRHHPPARAPRRHPGRPDGVHQGPGLPDRRPHPRPPGHPGRAAHRPRLDQAARRRRDRGGPRRSHPHRGHRDALPDVDRLGVEEDRGPGPGRRPRRHRRGPGRLVGRQDPARHPAQARCQRQRRPEQPVQADADADHLQRQRGGPGRRGAAHAQRGPDADPLRGPPGRGGHPAVGVPAGQGPGPGPRRRRPAQGHRHAGPGHRHHPRLRRPSGRPRGAVCHAVRLLGGAGQPHPGHDPGPPDPAGPARTSRRSWPSCSRRSPSSSRS